MVYAMQQVVCRLIRITADNQVYFTVVDLYNSVSGTWSTAQLSVARIVFYGETSVGNLAIFAGGSMSNFGFALCYKGFVLELVCADDACLRREFFDAVWCMRCSRLYAV